ncbi:hypothetical protein B7G55_19645 [Aeromonas hydrophila]|uniref:hypothetical protein n=1 Tax=Aeromonas hydrophila TaxID=644 RepID=UPI000A1F5BDD|nr:hypothetical protein [Aeromonas hydrophila]OSP50021.1 hypothetical protein B7G55_19645 [Aeromonas hydrophila]
MAPKKKATQTGDDKSPQLAAAAVGAGTELVQAPPQPKKDGEVLVDPDAEAARIEAEQLAAEEARLAAEAQAAEAARLEAEQREAANQNNADWLLGQFDVKAKSPAGFWRCEVQFLHSSQTRVFVVTAKDDVPHDHSCEIPCCYLTAEQAQRVYHEPWLVCTEYEVMGG